LFSSNPLTIIDGVPIFMREDKYALEYDRIAQDHLDHEAVHGVNPFMTENQIGDSDMVTLSLAQRHFRSGARILDAGIGLGSIFRSLGGFRRFGVDVALPYLRRTRKFGIEVARAKIEKLPFFDEYFDGVLSTDVLEHVHRLDAATAELIRVLRPGGCLVVRVPNEESLESYVENDQGYQHTHVRSFSLDGLRLHFGQCYGLEYLEHAYAGFDFTIHHQLRFPPPRGADPVVHLLRAHADDSPALKQLSLLVTTNLEEAVDALIELRAHRPELFAQMAPNLLKAKEVVVVFRKPAI